MTTHLSIHFRPRAPSILTESDNDDDGDNEIVAPELDELCAADAGTFGGDGYPRPAPLLKKWPPSGPSKLLPLHPISPLPKPP
jgi:hypothetical protein